MPELECFPQNTFIDAIPLPDEECGCVENYDLAGWNDTPPIDTEDGSFNPYISSRRFGEPCTIIENCCICEEPIINNCCEELCPVKEIDYDTPECTKYDILDLTTENSLITKDTNSYESEIIQL